MRFHGKNCTVFGRWLQQKGAESPFISTSPLWFESRINIARRDYKIRLLLAQRVIEIDPRSFYDVR